MHEILLNNFRSEFFPLFEKCGCGGKKKPKGGKKKSAKTFKEAPPNATTVETASKNGFSGASQKASSVQAKVLNNQRFAKDIGYKA